MSKGAGGGAHGGKGAGGGGAMPLSSALSKQGIDIEVSRHTDASLKKLFGDRVPTAAELKGAYAVPGLATQLKVSVNEYRMRIEIWGAGVMGERRIYSGPEGRYAVHETFFLQSHLQGKGIGSRMLANQEALYRRMGLREIQIPRAAETGRYFWARHGFTATDMPAMRQKWSAYLRAQGIPVGNASRASMRQIVSHPEGKRFLMQTNPYEAVKKL